MGLMARDILYHGKFVVMYYGQDYMGTLQAYLGALFFNVFGPTVFALRFGVVLELTCFLVVMYILSCLLYTRLVGILSLALLSLGSSEMLHNHVFAGGGSNEVLLFGALLSLLAAHLALNASHTRPTPTRRRYASFACWGLLAGLAIWSDPLVLPFVVMPGVLILRYCWHERKSLAPFLVTLGFLIGFSPYLIFFATVPREQVTNRLLPFSAQLQLVHTPEKTPVVPLPIPEHTQQATQPASPILPGDQQALPFAPLALRLLGLVMVSLPALSGGMALCPIKPDDAWPLSWHSSPQLLQCSAIHGLWGLGLILLWGCAVWLTIRWLRTYRRQTRQQAPPDETMQRQASIRSARLTILVAAGLTTLIYGVSSVSTSPLLHPWNNARYLIALDIATPSLLIVLWEMLDILKGSPRFLRHFVAGVNVVTLLGVLVVLAQGTLTTLSLRATVQRANVQQSQLVAGLENQGIRRFYTDYWTCNRLVFVSQESLTCAVLDDRLQPSLDRIWSYRTLVYSDPRAAFVFPNNSSMLKAFIQRIAGHEQAFTHSVIGSYVVYWPV